MNILLAVHRSVLGVFVYCIYLYILGLFIITLPFYLIEECVSLLLKELHSQFKIQFSSKQRCADVLNLQTVKSVGDTQIAYMQSHVQTQSLLPSCFFFLTGQPAK